MTSDQLFGMQTEIPAREAQAISESLEVIWRAQIDSARVPGRISKDGLFSPAVDDVQRDLDALKYWFDPVASGKRLREVLNQLPPVQIPDSTELGQLALRIGEDRALVTPEGRLVAWAIARSRLNDNPAVEFSSDIYLSPQTCRTALTLLNDTYRVWARQRLDDVVGLLVAETRTLRPTAAGLLFVLLINRNTSPERRLPESADSPLVSEMSAAIAAPAVAFARELAESDRASSRGVDLYRGWAMGEIARRLGSGLHREGGIWIASEAEGTARRRLVEALQARPDVVRARIPSAIDSALQEYDRVRPALSALGLAHERPTNTRAIVRSLMEASATGVRL